MQNDVGKIVILNIGLLKSTITDIERYPKTGDEEKIQLKGNYSLLDNIFFTTSRIEVLKKLSSISSEDIFCFKKLKLNVRLKNILKSTNFILNDFNNMDNVLNQIWV